MRTGVSALCKAVSVLLVVCLGTALLRATAPITAIQGVAWTATNAPLAFAKVRLRNVVNGRIEGGAVADADGRFVFKDIPPGAYLIELVNDDGRVLAVGHTFSLADGDTVATFVRLPQKAPWFHGFFSNAAALVAVAAATTGITSMAPEAVPPVSSSR
jgi:hypothetical protein